MDENRRLERAFGGEREARAQEADLRKDGKERLQDALRQFRVFVLAGREVEAQKGIGHLHVVGHVFGADFQVADRVGADDGVEQAAAARVFKVPAHPDGDLFGAVEVRRAFARFVQVETARRPYRRRRRVGRSGRGPWT